MKPIYSKRLSGWLSLITQDEAHTRPRSTTEDRSANLTRDIFV